MTWSPASSSNVAVIVCVSTFCSPSVAGPVSENASSQVSAVHTIEPLVVSPLRPFSAVIVKLPAPSSVMSKLMSNVGGKPWHVPSAVNVSVTSQLPVGSATALSLLLLHPIATAAENKKATKMVFCMNSS